jgi:hypothetical protein
LNHTLFQMKDKRTIRIQFGFGLSKAVVMKTISIKDLSDTAADRKINDTVQSESVKRKAYPQNWWLVD